MTCPEGRTSLSWSPAEDRGNNDVGSRSEFSGKRLRGACPRPSPVHRSECRSITVRPRKDQYEALHAARSREGSEEYRSDSNAASRDRGHDLPRRSGACGLRRSRYIGEAKVHLQHVATAAAINVTRISGLANRQAKRSNEDIPLREVDGPRVCGLRNSPAVSHSR